MRTGGAVIARVRGASGIGKSALVQTFLDGVVNRHDAVVLRGRAYERESIAYKAADGVLDALSQCLVAFERRGETVSLPRDAAALAQLFPVLKRAPGIPAERADGGDDPLALRQRAFGALRAILWQLARLGPTVLHLDDVQWGDVDSAMLLLEVIRPPAPPPVLVILGYRDGPELRGRPVSSVPQRSRARRIRPARHPVNPLTFLRSARPRAQRARRGRRGRAARWPKPSRTGSGGNAFFVEDLARSAKEQGPRATPTRSSPTPVPTLEDMIRRRVARLDEGARCLLELAAVHGGPIPMSISDVGCRRWRAARLPGGRAPGTPLRSHRDARRARGGGGRPRPHSRGRRREPAARLLAGPPPPARRRLRARARRRCRGRRRPLVRGGRVRASLQARRARRRARRGQARVRSRDAAIPPDPRRPSAETRRTPLASEGAWPRRSAARAAAPRPRECTSTRPAARRNAERTALERAAASQLLFCGQIDEGTRILRRILARSGRGAPSSAWTAVGWFIFYSVWLRLIGLRVAPRQPEELPQKSASTSRSCTPRRRDSRSSTS